MKESYEIIILLFVHWVADFLLQTKNMAINKSKEVGWLTFHVAVYSLTWFILLSFIYGIEKSFIFSAMTFSLHFITDFWTSKWTSKLYRDSKFYGFPSFFSVIGLDQWLHFAQLILTLDYIKSL